MYEENCTPLPHQDASVIFADQLAKMKRQTNISNVPEITPDSVVRWADSTNEKQFAAICRRLLLPGSRIVGLSHLQQLAKLADDGHSCILCLNHRSNLDVPTLFTLLEDQSDGDAFRRIVWLAGRKLEEDTGLTRMLIQCFNRIIVTPPGWFTAQHTDDEIHQARLINVAAERAMAKLRKQGWILGLFPGATRIRPGVESTEQAIEQTDSFLRMFEYLLLCNIDGCTMPVSSERDFTHETPRLDRMIYTFGPVQPTEQWREKAASRFPDLDQRLATANAIREDIEALAPKK